MKLKVFRLKNGKLELVGAREARQGDAIIEGETSMVELHESVTPTGKEIDAAAKAIKARQGKEGLANSYRQAHPGATDAEVAAFCQGRNPDIPETLDDSLKRLLPGWNQEAMDAFKKGR